jgi:cytochrome c-type biogenesis protein CcsB
MPKWIRWLSSLKLNTALLVFLVLLLGAATIVESRLGTQAARSIYYAPWFQVLLALFAVNIACSLFERWPWGRERIGFAITHASIVIILLGAGMTQFMKIEGQLALWEGQSSTVFVDASQPGELVEHPLPFTVHLDAFEIDYYPGTLRPAQFRSRVRVGDPSAGQMYAADIEMNHELAYGGYRFFQSSYRQEEGREMTVLSVSKDPGQPLVFAGYILLLIGMITVLTTRLNQHSRLPPDIRAGGPDLKVALLLLVLGLGTNGAVLQAEADFVDLPDEKTVSALRALPVQHDGRVMPLDTVAREGVWNVTGQRTWNGIDPVSMVVSWVVEPERWSNEPIVKIGSPQLITELGLPPGTRYASFQELASIPRLMELIREARRRSEIEEPLDPVMKAARKVERRLVWLQQFTTRRTLRLIPDPSDPQADWSQPERIESTADLAAIEDRLRAANLPGYPSQKAMQREITYNTVRPTRVAWLVLLIATIASLLAWIKPRPWLDWTAVGALFLGFAVMTWGLAMRWQIAGRIPASNMYESMLFLAWGVGLFALVAMGSIRNRLVVLNAAMVSTLTMILVDLLPMDPFVHPMPPVLSGTPWLAIHVPITMVSYSVFAVGVLLAHMQIGIEIFTKGREDLVRRTNQLLYWYMHVGSILLAAGIITGSIWAASSWGRYWGWDPKEVWSLIAFLAYMAILHGRFDRLIGPFGTAAFSIVAFWTVLMTYIGVNFVLSAGLHSYGFGESTVVNWMIALGLVEIIFLAVGWVAHRRQPKRPAGLRMTG